MVPHNIMSYRSALSILENQAFAIMGIVNVTPDSFFDGGKYNAIDEAVEHGIALCNEGADILDIGGASSRPGAALVTPEEEAQRILPVIEKLIKKVQVPISVDTVWASVAEKSLKSGATLLNDISAGRIDPEMVRVVSEHECEIVLMHSRGTMETMHRDPFYTNVVEEVKKELSDSIQQFIYAGVKREKIILDPGIGFSKNAEHNIILLRGLEKIEELGFPVLIGTSRKSFIGKITGAPVENRLYGSLGSIASAYFRGARFFRVHDVRQTREFLQVLAAVES